MQVQTGKQKTKLKNNTIALLYIVWDALSSSGTFGEIFYLFFWLTRETKTWLWALSCMEAHSVSSESSHQPSPCVSLLVSPFHVRLFCPLAKRWRDSMGVPSRKLWLIRDRNKVGWLNDWRSRGNGRKPRLPWLRLHRETVQGHIITTTHAKRRS